MTKTKDAVDLIPAKKKPFKKANFNFQYRFTLEELEEKSKHLANSCKDRNCIEDQKKSVMSDFKSKLDSKSAEINIVSEHINSGYEWVTNGLRKPVT